MDLRTPLLLISFFFVGCSTSHESPPPDGGPDLDGGRLPDADSRPDRPMPRDGGGPVGLYDDCGQTSDCTLVANTCCGVCGRPTAGDVAAVNESRTEDYYLDVACPEARTEPPTCPGCAGFPNASLVATCDMTGIRAACVVVDIENDPALAGCTTDADCTVRVPDCCECGASTSLDNLIAVRVDAEAALQAIVCDLDSGCAACEPTYPGDAIPVCDESIGLCRIVVAGGV